MAKTVLTKIQKSLLIALEKSNNHISNACKMLKIARKVYYHNYKTSSLFANMVDDIKYKIDDDLEQTALATAMEEKNPQLLMFMLKTRLKDRGYQEKIVTEEIGKQKNAIIYDASKLTDEQLSKILKEEEEPKDDF